MDGELVHRFGNGNFVFALEIVHSNLVGNRLVVGDGNFPPAFKDIQVNDANNASAEKAHGGDGKAKGLPPGEAQGLVG